MAFVLKFGLAAWNMKNVVTLSNVDLRSICVCVCTTRSQDICIYIYIENVYRTIQHVTSLELTNGHSEEPSG